jgi:hypothetical protein
MNSSISWDGTLCSPLKVKRRFGRTCRQGRKIGQARNEHETGSEQLAYPSTLKMEAVCSSEMSVEFQQTGMPLGGVTRLENRCVKWRGSSQMTAMHGRVTESRSHEHVVCPVRPVQRSRCISSGSRGRCSAKLFLDWMRPSVASVV